MFGNIDRMIDNSGAHINSGGGGGGGMRHHLNHVMEDHHHGHHNGRPNPIVNPSHKMDHYGGDPYNFVDEMSGGNYTPVPINNPPPTTPTPVKKRGRRKKSEINR